MAVLERSYFTVRDQQLLCNNCFVVYPTLRILSAYKLHVRQRLLFRI